MHIDQPSPADEPEVPWWHQVFLRAVPDSSDLAREVRCAVDHGLHDPVDTVEMVAAAEETTAAVVTALSSPWSLYTPQDAAHVAAGLFVQMQHQAAALQELGRAVERIAGRGETLLPSEAGPGQEENLADALASLQSASDQVASLAARHAPVIVRALEAAPAYAPIPANIHETLVAVAALLTEQHDGTVTLNQPHESDVFDDPEGLGCGCDITLHTDDEEYNFHRGDSEWALVKESDGLEFSDGSVAYGTYETLAVSLETPHPQQLTDSVLRFIADDQRPSDFTGGLRSVPAGGA